MGAAALLEFVAALKKPPKVIILVKAGPPVDSVVFFHLDWRHPNRPQRPV